MIYLGDGIQAITRKTNRRRAVLAARREDRVVLAVDWHQDPTRLWADSYQWQASACASVGIRALDWASTERVAPRPSVQGYLLRKTVACRACYPEGELSPGCRPVSPARSKNSLRSWARVHAGEYPNQQARRARLPYLPQGERTGIRAGHRQRSRTVESPANAGTRADAPSQGASPWRA